MNCAELEILLCEYVDGQLAGPQHSAQRGKVEIHLQGCASCRELVDDARAGLEFLRRAEPIEAPDELITRLLFHSPASHPQVEPKRGFRAWLAGWLGPVLQPRFAMGMAMTILSFSMLGKFANLQQRQLTPADLHPVKVWVAMEDKVQRTWDQAVKYFDNLRLVYEIQSRLKEWTEQDENERRAQSSGSAIEPRTKGSTKQAPASAPLEGER